IDFVSVIASASRGLGARAAPAGTAKTAENLCDRPKFTGYTLDGGYAEFTVADQEYCFAIPMSYSDTEAAPLLCAGLIGYRSFIGPATPKPHDSAASWAPFGRGARRASLPSNSTRRSSTRRSGLWSLRVCAPSPKEEPSFAPAST